MEKRGREIPFSANLTEITGSEALYLIDALDYVDLEYHYQSLGYFPKARAVTSVRIAQGFGKQPYLVTGYWDTDPDIAARGIEKSTTLFQTMIAEGYGTGASFAIMEGLHNIKQDFTALTSYYRFPRDYPFLFEGMTPEKGQVGLLYLWEAREYFNYADLRGLGQLLSDCGYQFNVIFGAEESTWWGRPKYIVPAPDHPLTLEALKANPLVIVPQLDDITPNHADILLQYVKQGGKLLVFSTSDLLGNIDWERGQDSPAVKELLAAINAGNVTIGEGKVLAVKKLWGKTYTTDPQPTMQQSLIDLLTAENILPEVSMSTNNYVSAFMHQASDSLTVHFVNYDYNPDADTTQPASSRQVEITLPDGLVSGNPTINLYSPDTAMHVLTGELTGNKLSLTLPEFDIWSVLWIGDKASLQTGIAAHPTSTPLPTATATPQIEPGYVIYDDTLTGGWQASPYDAEIDLNATALVYQGSKAIELKALGWGALNLSYTEAVDTTGYDSLVLNVNPAGMDNLNISVTIFDQEKSVHYVYVADYLNGTTLRPNEWRTVVIPLSDLNPDGAAFNRIFISNESDRPASFYLDELFFTKNKLQAKISTHPSSTPSPTAASTLSIEPGLVIYGDSLGTWQASPYDAEVNLYSTTLIYQGSKAIELKALGWGALDLTYPEAVDTTGYDSLVLSVNPAEKDNLNFSVTIFDHKRSVNYVFLADYIKGNPLLPNEWRTIVIPLSDLNPDGAAFNRIFIQNESDEPASFYLDELFFAKAP